jgi:hypothetical protein
MKMSTLCIKIVNLQVAARSMPTKPGWTTASETRSKHINGAELLASEYRESADARAGKRSQFPAGARRPVAVNQHGGPNSRQSLCQ